MFPLRLTSKACRSPIKRRSAEWAAVARLAGVKSLRFLFCFPSCTFFTPLAVTSASASHFCNGQLLVSVARTTLSLTVVPQQHWQKDSKARHNESHYAKNGTWDPLGFHPIPSRFQSSSGKTSVPRCNNTCQVSFQVPLLPFASKSNQRHTGSAYIQNTTELFFLLWAET